MLNDSYELCGIRFKRCLIHDHVLVCKHPSISLLLNNNVASSRHLQAKHIVPMYRPAPGTNAKLIHDPYNAMMHAVLKHALKSPGNPLHRFLGFIDIDEFIVLLDPRDTNIETVLRDYKSHPGLSIYWIHLGSSGHVKRPTGPVVPNYRSCVPADHYFNTQFKTFVNTAWGPVMYSPHRATFNQTPVSGQTDNSESGDWRERGPQQTMKSSGRSLKRSLTHKQGFERDGQRPHQVTQRLQQQQEEEDEEEVHVSSQPLINSSEPLSPAAYLRSRLSSSVGSVDSRHHIRSKHSTSWHVNAENHELQSGRTLTARVGTPKAELPPYMVDETHQRIASGRNNKSSHVRLAVYHYATKSRWGIKL